MRTLKIATRNSQLAMWQAEFVKAELLRFHPDLSVEIIGFKTRGDIILDSPLAKIGGKGLFVKELEIAMLEGNADIAVHSMKDVPMEFPEGLALETICQRASPLDAFVSNQYESIDDLPSNAIVGTSSLRRQCQLKAVRPDLNIRDLRGNVNTRLAKLDAGNFDAIILAAAGLQRLGFDHRIKSRLSSDVSLPAGGQGAVGIECRTDDQWVKSMLAPLHHVETAAAVLAERAMNRRLEGGCQVPIACFAQLSDDLLAVKSTNTELSKVESNQQVNIHLRGLVGSPDGSTMLRAEQTAQLTVGDVASVQALGIQVADKLIEQGAKDILQAVYGKSGAPQH